LAIGYAAGPPYKPGGSGSNFLCLPEHPQWKKFFSGYQEWKGAIGGVEYELYRGKNVFSKRNHGGQALRDNPAPCAVCYVESRSTVLMVPARTQCLDGWTTEYKGYLASDANNLYRSRSSFICLDEAPEVAVGGKHQNQSFIFSVQVACGSLPCSVYHDGRELTCIVCSK